MSKKNLYAYSITSDGLVNKGIASLEKLKSIVPSEIYNVIELGTINLSIEFGSHSYIISKV